MGKVRKMTCVTCDKDLTAKPGPEFTAEGRPTKRLRAPDRVEFNIVSTLTGPDGRKQMRTARLSACPGCLKATQIQVLFDALVGKVQ